LSIRTPNHDTLSVLIQAITHRFAFSVSVLSVVTFLVLSIRLRAFSLRPCGKRCLCFLYLTCRHWMISSKTNVRFISTVSPDASSLLHRPRSFNPRVSPFTNTVPFHYRMSTHLHCSPPLSTHNHCSVYSHSLSFIPPLYDTVVRSHFPLTPLFSVRPQRYITDDAATRVHVYQLSQTR